MDLRRPVNSDVGQLYVMTKFLMMVLIALFILGACVPCRNELPREPKRPTNLRGWRKYHDKEAGVTFCAELLLKRGESSDNGKYGVRVTQIHDADKLLRRSVL